MKIHVITDIFDPSKGSEFQLAQKALITISESSQKKIILWTLLKGNNKETIQNWLIKKDFSNRVDVRLLPMTFANLNGDHRTKIHFYLDLARLYLFSLSKIDSKDLIWKCGQVNYFFNIFFLFVRRKLILGPLSGFEYPIIYKVYGIPICFRIYYCLYGLANLFFRLIFKLCIFLSNKEKTNFLLATPSDFDELNVFKYKNIHLINEIDIKGIINTRDALAASEVGFSYDVIWAGAFINRKNPLLALESLTVYLRENLSANVLMLGDGPLSNQIKEKHEQLPNHIRSRLILTKNLDRNKFLRILFDAKVLLVTSLREVNSVLVYEALCMGVPIVASNVSGMRTSITDYGHLFDITSKYVCREIVDNLLHFSSLNYRTLSPQKFLTEHFKEQAVLKAILYSYD